MQRWVPSRAAAWRAVERSAWTIGGLAAIVWIVGTAHGLLGARAELVRFEALRPSPRQAAQSPDFTLWSPLRIRLWQEVQTGKMPPPLGVLRIARLQLEVPILEGTDEVTLNRAVGHIEDTPPPGGDGNSGIAGHRDGFFRVLKDIADGDTLAIETPRGVDTFVVEHRWIVAPDDVWVLDATPGRAVTLVTCYPFYFVGAAPQRFIVRAVVVNQGQKKG